MIPWRAVSSWLRPGFSSGLDLQGGPRASVSLPRMLRRWWLQCILGISVSPRMSPSQRVLKGTRLWCSPRAALPTHPCTKPGSGRNEPLEKGRRSPGLPLPCLSASTVLPFLIAAPGLNSCVLWLSPHRAGKRRLVSCDSRPSQVTWCR